MAKGMRVDVAVSVFMAVAIVAMDTFLLQRSETLPYTVPYSILDCRQGNYRLSRTSAWVLRTAHLEGSL